MVLIKLNDNINDEGLMEKDNTTTWLQQGLGMFANVEVGDTWQGGKGRNMIIQRDLPSNSTDTCG